MHTLALYIKVQNPFPTTYYLSNSQTITKQFTKTRKLITLYFVMIPFLMFGTLHCKPSAVWLIAVIIGFTGALGAGHKNLSW